MAQSRRIRVGLAGLVISGLAFLFIITQIDLGLFAEAWVSARYIYLLPCILFLLLGLVTRALRWQVLLDGKLPLIRAFSIMNVAYLVNGVLPLRIGEVARVYLATQVRKPVPVMQTTSSIIVERLLDLLAVVILMLLALAVGPVPRELQQAGTFGLITALAGFAILMILAARRNLLHRLIAQLIRWLPALKRLNLDHWLDQFLDGLQPIFQPRTFLLAVMWTAISWLLSVIAGYLLMFAFFDEGSWAATALYIAAAAFAIALPAVPGNIGTYEASILLALVAMGYEQSSTAIAFAVMVHAVNVFVHASTGIIGFIQEGVSLEQLSQGVRRIQSSDAG